MRVNGLNTSPVSFLNVVNRKRWPYPKLGPLPKKNQQSVVNLLYNSPRYRTSELLFLLWINITGAALPGKEI